MNITRLDRSLHHKIMPISLVHLAMTFRFVVGPMYDCNCAALYAEHVC